MIDNNRELNKINRIKNRGFTLVELMVVIAIFIMITSTVIFNYSDYRSSASMQNLTDEIALSIRKAQSFAVGARGVNSEFTNSYGIHFSSGATDEPLIASSKSFLIFIVKAGDSKKYSRTGSSESDCGAGTDNCFELFKIKSNDKIEKIKLIKENTQEEVLSSDSYLDIIFTRPSSRANFCYRTDGIDTACSDIDISSAIITISNGQIGDKLKMKDITIYNTGQISIQ